MTFLQNLREETHKLQAYTSVLFQELPVRYIQILIENDVWHEAAKLREEQDGGVGMATFPCSTISVGILIEKGWSPVHSEESLVPVSWSKNARDRTGETEPDLEVETNTSS